MTVISEISILSVLFFTFCSWVKEMNVDSLSTFKVKFKVKIRVIKT